MSDSWNKEAACFDQGKLGLDDLDCVTDASVTTGYCTGEQQGTYGYAPSLLEEEGDEDETVVKSVIVGVTRGQPASDLIPTTNIGDLGLRVAIRMTDQQPRSAIGVCTPPQATNTRPLFEDEGLPTNTDVSLNSNILPNHSAVQRQNAGGGFSGAGPVAGPVPNPASGVPATSRNLVQIVSTEASKNSQAQMRPQARGEGTAQLAIPGASRNMTAQPIMTGEARATQMGTARVTIGGAGQGEAVHCPMPEVGQGAPGVSSSHVYAHQAEAFPTQSGCSLPGPSFQGDISSNAMNIPPSLNTRRVNNTEKLVGMAEQQLSFHTIQSFSAGPAPLGASVQQVDTATPIAHAGAQSVGPSNPVYPMNQFDSDRSGYNNASVNTPLNGSQNASNLAFRSSRLSMFKDPLTDQTLVRRLPVSILKFLATRLEGPACRNYWYLLELHGWNYEDTLDFHQQNHTISPFHSLLNCDGFEEYSLKHLKLDLEEMPRKDVLYDLSLKIEEFNKNLAQSSQ